MPSVDCVVGHTVYIYDRGGEKRLFQLGKVHRVRWGRVRDDISEAQIDLTIDQCIEQAALLDQVEPMRHEIVIYRGDERQWEGPITLTTETRTTFSIHAKDVLYYLTNCTMRQGWSNAYPNVGSVIQRAVDIVDEEFGNKEARELAVNPDLPSYNILPWIVPHTFPDDARTAAVTTPYEYQVQEHLDSLAADGGLDYCAVGRSIHFWDVHRNAMGQTPTATEADFLGEVVISRYGSELTTVAHVTGGEDRVGHAGVIDPYYGEVEALVSAYDESKDEGAPPTQGELDSQAQRYLAGTNPVPVVVRVPDGSTLNPQGVLSVSDLVPGVYIPLRAKLLVRTYQQMQKLNTMTVEETPSGETITVTLTPASAEDEPEEE